MEIFLLKYTKVKPIKKQKNEIKNKPKKKPIPKKEIK